MHRPISILVLLVFICTLAGAVEPVREKPAHPARSAPPPAGDGRVGGDNAADAVVIDALPFADSGVTCGYADDYDAVCTNPSTSPDVVYSFTPGADMVVDIDLCGSAYDTKVFVLDATLQPIACSDDTFWDAGNPCGQWNAKLEFLALAGGETCYIVVDGYGGECGAYELAVVEHSPCDIACPPGSLMENEPPMVDGYVDLLNAGCFSDWADPLGYILPVPGQGNVTTVCGVNGYYPSPSGLGYDHDWWEVTVGEGGVVVVMLSSQRSTWLMHFALPAGDCNQLSFIEEATCRPCETTSLTISGEPGSTVYFWVHTHYNSYPNGEYPYLLQVDGGSVATAEMSWSSVKDLYR